MPVLHHILWLSLPMEVFGEQQSQPTSCETLHKSLITLCLNFFTHKMKLIKDKSVGLPLPQDFELQEGQRKLSCLG